MFHGFSSGGLLLIGCNKNEEKQIGFLNAVNKATFHAINKKIKPSP